ncbi:DUF2269 family protein [Gracilibacillus timonensis]|uniref:DUF2269 family protein n=1 Tax=Gracilibacillus timonensis TaxID=1816696 RepID=UPI00098EA4F9|nr:DUF2269 family protein [Gracilibacillus timonensis]
MMTFYNILILIHIISAIIGIGPGFVLTTIVKHAHTMTDIRFAFTVKRRLHHFIQVGGALLLLSGLLLGVITPSLFQQGWYLTSLVLYLLVLILGATLLRKISAPIRQMLADQTLTETPAYYHELRNRLLRVEYAVNALLLVIILLMVLKPF